jgi:hypothetical protein
MQPIITEEQLANEELENISGGNSYGELKPGGLTTFTEFDPEHKPIDPGRLSEQKLGFKIEFAGKKIKIC